MSWLTSDRTSLLLGTLDTLRETCYSFSATDDGTTLPCTPKAIACSDSIGGVGCVGGVGGVSGCCGLAAAATSSALAKVVALLLLSAVDIGTGKSYGTES